MCIAIHKPRGVTLPKVVLQNCFNRNDHGAGFAVLVPGDIHVEKGFDDFDAFFKAFEPFEKDEAIIHFRVASPGSDISKDNCHPFVINLSGEKGMNHSYAIIHNGRLDWEITKEKSDTRLFVEEFLTEIFQRDPWFLQMWQHRLLLANQINIRNKMIILHLQKDESLYTTSVINRSEGIEWGGCWFSNLTFTDEPHAKAVNDYDRKKYKDWVPVLYIEPPTYDYSRHNAGGHGYPYVQPQLPLGNGNGAGASATTNQNQSGTPNSAIKNSTDPLKVVTEDWAYSPKFGWYCTNKSYHGIRSMADYCKWAKEAYAQSKTGSEDKSAHILSGFTADEVKLVRKELVKIINNIVPTWKPAQGAKTEDIFDWVCSLLQTAETGNDDVFQQIIAEKIIKNPRGVEMELEAKKQSVISDLDELEEGIKAEVTLHK